MSIKKNIFNEKYFFKILKGFAPLCYYNELIDWFEECSETSSNCKLT
jgi:hypothetical protein